MPDKPPESEARRMITAMLIITGFLIVFVGAATFLSVSVKSGILIAWMAVMMAVLRRYR